MLTCLLTSSLVFVLSLAASSLLCRNSHECSIRKYQHLHINSTALQYGAATDRTSVRPMLMSDIWHRRIGGNWTHRRWKGNGAPTSDAPNLQRRVYDVAAAATECNRTQAHCAREAVIKCPAWRHHCAGSVVRRSVDSGHPCNSHVMHHVLL